LMQSAAGHEFWIQPGVFVVAPREPIQIALMVGNGHERQLSPIPRRRIVRYEAIGSDGRRKNLLPNTFGQDQSVSVSVGFETTGTRMLVLETDNTALSQMPADRFNNYVLAEGLTLLQRERERTDTTRSEGVEIYRRCSKVIVHVGSSTHDRLVITRVYGLSLEIVPDGKVGGGAMSARVFFHDRPLSGALVKFTNLSAIEHRPYAQTTNSDGRVFFTIPESGVWLFSVVWSISRPRGSSSQFETYFSSLVFNT